MKVIVSMRNATFCYCEKFQMTVPRVALINRY